ncbi:hypothetical protein ACLX1H_008235 [Fusarium chlamydosporum]
MDSAGHVNDLELPFQLHLPVTQKLGTLQCWWLALLEVARVSGKLRPIFEPQGHLVKHFAVDQTTGVAKVPAEGDLPKGYGNINSSNTTIATQPSTASNKNEEQKSSPRSNSGNSTNKKASPSPKNQGLDDFNEHFKKQMPIPKSGQLVYGPQWQRMIMFYLLEKGEDGAWNKALTACLFSQRQAALTNLLKILRVEGISVDTAITLTADVSATINELHHDQYCLVDRVNPPRLGEDGVTNDRQGGHCMPALVKHIKSKEPKHSVKVEVFNQSEKREEVLSCEVMTVDKVERLASETESNFTRDARGQPTKWIFNAIFPIKVTNTSPGYPRFLAKL